MSNIHWNIRGTIGHNLSILLFFCFLTNFSCFLIFYLDSSRHLQCRCRCPVLEEDSAWSHVISSYRRLIWRNDEKKNPGVRKIKTRTRKSHVGHQRAWGIDWLAQSTSGVLRDISTIRPCSSIRTLFIFVLTNVK